MCTYTTDKTHFKSFKNTLKIIIIKNIFLHLINNRDDKKHMATINCL